MAACFPEENLSRRLAPICNMIALPYFRNMTPPAAAHNPALAGARISIVKPIKQICDRFYPSSFFGVHSLPISLWHPA
jgi:hypothetical protein